MCSLTAGCEAEKLRIRETVGTGGVVQGRMPAHAGRLQHHTKRVREGGGRWREKDSEVGSSI